MTARLMVREVGLREFATHSPDFEDDAIDKTPDPLNPISGEQRAIEEGERLCAEGNVEAFQVWTLITTRRRVMRTEEVTAP